MTDRTRCFDAWQSAFAIRQMRKDKEVFLVVQAGTHLITGGDHHRVNGVLRQESNGEWIAAFEPFTSPHPNPPRLVNELKRTWMEEYRTPDEDRLSRTCSPSPIPRHHDARTDDVNAIPVLPKLLQRIPECPTLTTQNRSVTTDH